MNLQTFESMRKIGETIAILRELVGNVLAHREFTSSYMAKFVIEKERMYIENANRAAKEGYITPDNTEPDPKNPIIASFFRNIGYADQLGSGVRNLFKYSKFYSGKDPEFKEGDIFRITVPLDEEFSFDFGNLSADKVPINADKMPIRTNNLSEQQKMIMALVEKQGRVTTKEVEHLLEVKERRARTILSDMVKMEVLEKKGAYKTTVYAAFEK